MTLSGDDSRSSSRPGLETLDADQCRALLGATSVGRVATTVGGLPSVLPVHLAHAGADLLFSPADGAGQGLAGTVIALEIDRLDPADGWSVVVTGVAHPTAAPEGRSGAAWYRLSTEVISGRRLTHQAMLVAGSVRPAAVPSAAATDVGTEGTALGPSECQRLLARGEVGRVVIMAGDAPLVFPVNYATDGPAVVFRTASPAFLARVGDGLVGFHVEQPAQDGQDGWAVQLLGLAEVVPPGVIAQRVETLGVRPWAGPAGRVPDRWVRITPLTISGVLQTARPTSAAGSKPGLVRTGGPPRRCPGSAGTAGRWP